MWETSEKILEFSGDENVAKRLAVHEGEVGECNNMGMLGHEA